MSKMDDLRAMREARYAANQARAAKTSPAGKSPAKGAAKSTAARPPIAPATPAKTTAKTAAKTAAKAKAVEETAAPATEELCGHRNMGGRSCTREKNHSAKSHRYS